MLKTVNVEVHGVVQGVFFRVSLRQQAEQLGVFGWCKNTGAGTVLCCFEGNSDQVDQLVRWAHEGPPSSRVTRVDVTEETPQHFDAFVIR